MRRFLMAIYVTLLFFPLARITRGDVPPEVVVKAKRATALVEIAGGAGVATAFCVDASGYFLTNRHVVEAAGDPPVLSLVLYPGEKEQKVLKARVVRSSKQADLALLKVDTAEALTALEIGDSGGLIETLPVVAFGYPFGRYLAAGADAYPTVTVSLGHITALRKARGELQGIQLDASLNPGNSGGPVLDEKGRVVGVVAEGIEGTGINLAVPSGPAHALLNNLEISLTPGSIAPDKRSQEQEFTIRIGAEGKAGQPQGEPPVVELSLSAGSADHRSYVAKPGEKNTFVVRAVPVPAGAGGSLLRVTLVRSAGEVILHTSDKTIQVGPTSVNLSRVRRIERGAKPRAVLTDGAVLNGEIAGLDNLEAFESGKRLQEDVRKETLLTVQTENQSVTSVDYRIVVRKADRILGEVTGDIAIGKGTSTSVEAQAGSTRAYAQAVLADRPVAYYRLDERNGQTVYDSISPRANGLLEGDVTARRAGALDNDPNGALEFIGNGYIHILERDAAKLGMDSSFTLEAWINQRSEDETQSVACKGFDQSPGYYRFLYNKANRSYQFNVKFDQSGTFGEDVLIPLKFVPLKQWHHLVGVYDAPQGMLLFYVDGVVGAHLSVAGKTLTRNQEAFEIAAMPDPKGTGFAYFFDGALDEVAIYRRALSSERINVHYRLGAGRRAPGP